MVPLDKVCAVEIWVEVFGGDPKFMQRRDSVEINSVLRKIPGWRSNKSKRRYGPYGVLKGFEKV